MFFLVYYCDSFSSFYTIYHLYFPFGQLSILQNIVKKKKKNSKSYIVYKKIGILLILVQCFMHKYEYIQGLINTCRFSYLYQYIQINYSGKISIFKNYSGKIGTLLNYQKLSWQNQNFYKTIKNYFGKIRTFTKLSKIIQTKFYFIKLF